MLKSKLILLLLVFGFVPALAAEVEIFDPVAPTLPDLPTPPAMVQASSSAFFIVSSNPVSQATQVPISIEPSLTFSLPLDPDTLEGHLELRQYAEAENEAVPVPATFSLSPAGNTVTFNLDSDLTYDTRYYFYVEAGLRDLLGDTLRSDQRWLHENRNLHDFWTATSSATTTYQLEYVAGPGGHLEGTLVQAVERNGTSTAVLAVPDLNYQFSGWSDGSLANPRTDANVSANLEVSANFELVAGTPISSSGGSISSSGRHLIPRIRPLPPLVLGAQTPNPSDPAYRTAMLNYIQERLRFIAAEIMKLGGQI